MHQRRRRRLGVPSLQACRAYLFGRGLCQCRRGVVVVHAPILGALRLLLGATKRPAWPFLATYPPGYNNVPLQYAKVLPRVSPRG